MNTQTKILFVIVSSIVAACNNKIPESGIEKTEPEKPVTSISNNQDLVEGIYTTQTDGVESGECKMSIEIIKTKNGYNYIFKTRSKNLKGIALFNTEGSEGKSLVLKGIKWDYYEGGEMNEDENDSVSKSNTKEPEIPVDISADYVQDTLTIQNYGNSMDSYTKIEDCGRKYIQLIKK